MLLLTRVVSKQNQGSHHHSFQGRRWHRPTWRADLPWHSAFPRLSFFCQSKDLAKWQDDNLWLSMQFLACQATRKRQAHRLNKIQNHTLNSFRLSEIEKQPGVSPKETTNKVSIHSARSSADWLFTANQNKGSSAIGYYHFVAAMQASLATRRQRASYFLSNYNRSSKSMPQPLINEPC